MEKAECAVLLAKSPFPKDSLICIWISAQRPHHRTTTEGVYSGTTAIEEACQKVFLKIKMTPCLQPTKVGKKTRPQ